MYTKVLLAVGLTVGLGVSQSHAQAGSGASAVTPSVTEPAQTRVPTLGDTPRVPRPPRRPRRANAVPVPSSQNGSSPARAAAGAGGR